MRLLYKLSPRLHLAYCMCKNALYFLKLAWLFLCGRLIVIDTQRPVSNGGYRYYALIISKRPVSARHTYDDL